jgi:hypothetical protein
MSSEDNIERSIAELNLTTRAETDQRILDDAYAALSKAAHKQRPTGIWQVIVHSRFTIPAAVAAMILLAFALFIIMSAEKAVKIEGIYSALNKAGNIHISEFQAGRSVPVLQVWACENLGMKLFKTDTDNQTQYTLWDTKNRVKMIKFLSSNAIQTEPITQQMLADFEKSAAGVADLIPFLNGKDIPEGAQWIRKNNQTISIAVPGTKAYDLTWIAKDTASGAVVYRKWRVFAESHTDLPKRIEWYSKSRPEEEYRFEKFAVIAYPSEDEITNIIRNIFGRPDNPEYRGTPEAHR